MQGDGRYSTRESAIITRIPFGAVGATALVVASILLFAGIAWTLGGRSGMEFAGVVTSGILTAALVALYYNQTTLLEDQINLRAQEINREVRMSHTETLRQRIHAWLGADEIPQTFDSVEDLIRDSGERLPKVTATDVEPAEAFVHSFDDPDEFRVVPINLERDRYFSDLLQNHAPELQERRKEINQLYSEFAEHRERFKTYFQGVSLNEDGLRAKPDVYLRDCIFEGIVKIERGRSDSWEDELESIMNGFNEGGNISPQEDEIMFMQGIRERRSLYRAIPEDQSVHDISDETAQGLAKAALRETVDRINTDEDPYRDVVKAAVILDTLEQELRELRAGLIEYAGRPVFPGDCKYLDEATLGNTEFSEGSS